MNRIRWVDYMKAFSILAVVLNHTNHILPELISVVYIVCLPAFFFTAGMFANTQLTPKDFFYRKTRRLLIPFFFFGIVTWVFWYFVIRNYGNDTDTTSPWWLPLLGLVSGKSEMLIQNTPLWFLCCLVSLEGVYYVLCRIRQKWLRLLMIVFIGAFGCFLSYLRQNWIWEISAAFIILPIYSLGAEYNRWIQEKARTISSFQLQICLFISAIGIFLGVKYNGDVGLHSSYIGNPILYYISCISVIGLWFSTSLLVDTHLKHTQLIQYIGENTLFILCTHKPTFSVIKGIAVLCNISLDFFETNLGSLCLWAGSFAVLLPASLIVNQFCPCILGKKKTTP